MHRVNNGDSGEATIFKEQIISRKSIVTSVTRRDLGGAVSFHLDQPTDVDCTRF